MNIKNEIIKNEIREFIQKSEIMYAKKINPQSYFGQ